MKVVLHGKLRRLFGESFEIATAVPAEAIEGVSRQLSGWPRDMLIDVLGFDTEEKIRTITTEKEIHLIPAVAGGGGGLGRVIVGAAMIAMVVFSGGTWTPIAMMVLSIGTGLVMSGIMQMMMKTPTLDKSEDPAASKYLGNGGNTTTIGTYRTIAYGRNRIGGHWLSLQVDTKSIVMGRFPVTAPA